MNLEPPSGSKISVTTEDRHPLILIPHGSGRLMRYFFGLCFLTSLGVVVVSFGRDVWTLPWGSVDDGSLAFIVLMIMPLWFLCVVISAWLAYRSFRPSPESLRLMPNGVTYDFGIPPPTWYDVSGLPYLTPRAAWRSVFPKRTRVELDRGKLRSLRLRLDATLLTVDTDAGRLNIAPSASEIERAWLFQLLAKRYSLSSVPG